MKYIKIINIANGRVNSEIKISKEKIEKEIQEIVDRLNVWLNHDKVTIQVLDR